ncbi:hypothetical protein [Nocardia cyriacigeorgica]|uniref:hypothetical protein n=1 Tax=Nocardia cyriacigeorgica TaxID=135487 RepID=UPI003CC7E80B
MLGWGLVEMFPGSLPAGAQRPLWAVGGRPVGAGCVPPPRGRGRGVTARSAEAEGLSPQA